MSRQLYPSDLTDAEWTKLKPLLPAHNNRLGSPREVELREVINALMYVADNGIKWRAMPHDLPAWQTVYGYFRRWSQSGMWEQINQALGQQVRVAVGREEQPSLGLIDSQSVKMAQKADATQPSWHGESSALRGNKRVVATGEPKGRLERAPSRGFEQGIDGNKKVRNAPPSSRHTFPPSHGGKQRADLNAFKLGRRLKGASDI